MQLSELHNLVLAEMTDAVVLTATTGEVLFWNRGAQLVFGYTAEEAQGAALQDLIVPLEALHSGKTALQLVIDHGAYLGAAAVRAKGGTLLYIDIGAKLVRCGAANEHCVLWSQKDVTASKVERDAQMAMRSLALCSSLFRMRSSWQMHWDAWYCQTARLTNCSDMDRTDCVAICLKC